mgnify:CR=1 FL=1|jgi:hypothetical protein
MSRCELRAAAAEVAMLFDKAQFCLSSCQVSAVCQIPREFRRPGAVEG